jgi:hypothetical protein
MNRHSAKNAALALITLTAGLHAMPAAAQFGVGPVGTQPYDPRRPPQPGVRLLPPEPLSPNSLGLIERDFMYMRATSPRPNDWMGGRWNPRVEVGVPGPRIYPPNGYYYGGYGYGYAGFPYGGGFVGFGGPGGFGFGLGFPANSVQREVIIYQNGAPVDPAALERAAATGQVDPNRREARPAPPRSQPRDDEFYLRNGSKGTESLATALDDLRKAWLNGDFGRLSARFKPEGKVRIFPGGRYKYSVEARDFAEMLRDAMGRIDTLAFELSRPEGPEGVRAFVTGKHTFLDAEKMKTETHISYLLERNGGKWWIVEAGSSTAPIPGHQE